MARFLSDTNELQLIRTILVPLAEVGANLRPALDERQMVITVQRAGVTLAKKTVSRREVERLLARGFIRPLPEPSRCFVITLKGEQKVRAANFVARSEADIEPESDMVSGDTRMINYKESPLAWLSRRKNADGKPLIDALQFAAGERLRADFTLAGLTPRMTLDWTRYGTGASSGIGHPGLATEVMTAARQRLHAALDALGPDYADLALDLCCFLKGIGDVEYARGMKKRTAKQHLAAALDRLVSHYGLYAKGPDQSAGIRVWNAP